MRIEYKTAALLIQNGSVQGTQNITIKRIGDEVLVHPEKNHPPGMPDICVTLAGDKDILILTNTIASFTVTDEFNPPVPVAEMRHFLTK